MTVRGGRALADAHTVNVLAAWQHYRWRAYVSTATAPWSKLSADDSWMASTLASDRRDLAFWGV